METTFKLKGYCRVVSLDGKEKKNWLDVPRAPEFETYAGAQQYYTETTAMAGDIRRWDMFEQIAIFEESNSSKFMAVIS
tara:strand:- start:8101 stop:8337 length:237 start_codon:yes stop_codon:yes gene_type:complete